MAEVGGLGTTESDVKITLETGENESDPTIELTDESARNAFIRKVYAGFALNIFLVSIVVIICLSVSPINNYFRGNVTAFLVLLTTTAVIECIVDLVSTLRKTPPYNYIVTIIAVICFGLIIAGSVDDTNYTGNFIYAAIVVIFVGTSLTILAYWNKLDITSKSAHLGKIRFGLLVVILVLVITVNTPVVTLICVFLFSLIIFLDFFLHTRLIFGKAEKKFNIEEHVYAALLLLFHTVYMFVFIRLILLLYFKYFY